MIYSARMLPTVHHAALEFDRSVHRCIEGSSIPSWMVRRIQTASTNVCVALELAAANCRRTYRLRHALDCVIQSVALLRVAHARQQLDDAMFAECQGRTDGIIAAVEAMTLLPASKKARTQPEPTDAAVEATSTDSQQIARAAMVGGPSMSTMPMTLLGEGSDISNDCGASPSEICVSDEPPDD
jgi:hypothetical protein